MISSGTVPNLHKDANAAPIQVLIPDDASVVQITIGAGNQSTSLPSGAVIVEICATDDCRVAFGTSGVDATSGVKRAFTKGAAVYKLPDTATHVACTQIGTSSGFLTITRLV